ncbi:MAG: LTA synthase family protein [Bacilli bacterium]|nr:LTA synthase family protein [Bacilli bacterium]
MKKKIGVFFKKIRKNIGKYLSSNRLFLSYVIFSLIEVSLLRKYTLGFSFDLRPFACDLGLIIMIGSFGYFFKAKKQFAYYLIWVLIFTLMCVVNSVYYLFYTSFASFSLLAELGLVGEVSDSLYEKFRVIDFIYIIFPFLFVLIHMKLKKGNYYLYIAKVEKGAKMFVKTLIIGLAVGAITMYHFDGSDASRLVKLWNRSYLVKRFGIVLYQGNDLIQSLKPKINSLFGYDEAAKEFKEFYAEKFKEEKRRNEYTDVLKDMNVIFIHMESIQNYFIDLKLNGVELTPTINKLSKEGMYFDHFYPQISVGTSSDTEFTLNTSLMPVSSGTAFVSYYKRHYIAIPQLLSDMGYYTFSSHGNDASMWNRNNMHPRLGYEELIFKDQFDVTDDNSVGLGISDYDFFLQLQEKLEKIEDEHEHYMGTLIQLSNHSPYASTKVNSKLYYTFDELDLTNTYTYFDEKTGTTKEIKDKYLDGSELGDYFISAHYADMALGTFFDYVMNSDHYENTVFVLYGDHDARISKEEYEYYFNYNTKTGEKYKSGDENFIDFDSVYYDLSKGTPLIIWTKNEEVSNKIRGINRNVIGMYDILPTIGNMMGFENKYALGHDIYDIKEDNVVIFPNGNFLTNKVYYNNTSGKYRAINSRICFDNTEGIFRLLSNSMCNSYDRNKYSRVLSNESNQSNDDFDVDYIEKLRDYTEKRLTLSNNIVVHDLIYKEGDNIPVVGGESSE